MTDRRPVARQLIEQLEAHGFSVVPSEQWRPVIEASAAMRRDDTHATRARALMAVRALTDRGEDRP